MPRTITTEDALRMLKKIGAGGGGTFQETDPTVPAWAKQPTKPRYTAEEVGALPDTTKIPSQPEDVGAEPAGTVETKVSQHNTNTEAHEDIRLLIVGLTTRLNALANSDDTTLDQMAEVVTYIKSNRSLIESVTTDKVNVVDIINNLTSNVANKPLSAAQGVALKGLIDALQTAVGNIPAYGVCSTAAETAAKEVTIPSFELKTGAVVIVKFTNANSIASPTLNVNGTGAKPIYRYGTTAASTGTTTTGWIAGAVQMFIYDGTGWIRDYWSNTTYSNVALGQGYATCSTAAATVAKTASLSSYTLTANGIVSVRFANDVPAGATLNINSKGAKAIYFRNAAITDGVIKAGDTATFIYNTYYRLISIDRWQNDIDDIFTSVKKYGAVGNGSTDDTSAIQQALSECRKVYIPAGTYKLSGELVISDNCELTLAQDAVLNFTQTSGNCISMKMSASIMGHHATVKVPYGFTGNVIYVSSTLNDGTESVITIPPWNRWDPQWKAGRYIKDLNICMPDTRGFHYAMNQSSPCSGTAIYLSADSSTTSTFIWGLNFSGIRIAGAFTYGIKAQNFGTGWNHEMRIEAFIEACETGVSLEDCNNAYISAVIQPKAGMKSDETKFPYAKCGIELIRSERTDLHGCRVWDWNDANSLWEAGGRYQHIAMIGNCTGTVLDDFFYWAMSNYDIRDLIYTDTPSNLEKMTIIQEPITRWFKPVNNEPYFDNGDGENRRLLLKSEQDALFETTLIKAFTDRLAEASDGAGGIFNEIGYMKDHSLNVNGVLESSQWHTSTGFISCKRNSVIEAKGMSFTPSNDICRAILFDASFNKIAHVNKANLVSNASYSLLDEYTETDDGFKITIKAANTAYIRFCVYTSAVSSDPVIAVDEEIKYTQVGTLTSGVKVNESNLIGMDGYEKKGRMTTQISSSSSDEQYPTAKAVYKAIQDSLGVIENGTY